MKKIIVFLIVSFTLALLIKTFGQDLQPESTIKINNKALYNMHNQHKNLSPIDKQMTSNDTQKIISIVINTQKLFKTGEKSLVWKPDTLITYNTTDIEGKHIFSYDGNGNLLTVLEEKLQSGAWDNFRRKTYTYNENENVLILLFEVWESGAWVNSDRNTYTYDSYGNITTELCDNWQSNAWVNVLRTTTTYDIDESSFTALLELWQSGSWEYSSKATYTYDGNGNLLPLLYEFWQSSAWVSFYRYTYTFDDNENILTELLEQLESSTWIDYHRCTFTYDGYGSRLFKLTELWQSDSWVILYKDSYTYDNNRNSITGKCEAWQSDSWQPNTSNLNLFSNQNILLEMSSLYRYEASFISFTNEIASIEGDNSIVIYPNPATDQILLSVSDYTNTTVEIFNIKGQLFISLPLQSVKTEIKIDNLPKGLYLLKIKNQTRNEVKKFMKE